MTKPPETYLGRHGYRPLEVARTEGPYVYDANGKRYIDFFQGWAVGNIGWSNRDVLKEIQKFDGPTYVAPGYSYAPWEELAKLLASIAPGELRKTFRATGGTEAVEIALQAAMIATKRSRFISFEGSYHGHSIGAMSVGMSYFRRLYGNLLPGCEKIAEPFDEAAARKIEMLLSKGDIAAVIAEPIPLNLGAVRPAQIFWAIVQAACKKYGTLLIADEVATGFGRTGKMFACDHFGLEPDILCLAKAIGGGYGALGATMMTKDVAEKFETEGHFYSTFGWHPLNVHATLAALRYFLDRKAETFAHATEISEYFAERLQQMHFREPPEIRIEGLAMCVDFNKKGYGAEIISRALSRGLLLADATDNDFIMYPALTIEKTVAKDGLDILESSL